MSSTSVATDNGTVTGATDLSVHQVIPHASVDRSDQIATALSVQPSLVIARREDSMENGAVFFMGMIVGAFILWLIQREGRRRRHRAEPAVADVRAYEVAALARRTATLEQIVTDPATRTAREIDALR